MTSALLLEASLIFLPTSDSSNSTHRTVCCSVLERPVGEPIAEPIAAPVAPAPDAFGLKTATAVVYKDLHESRQAVAAARVD